MFIVIIVNQCSIIIVLVHIVKTNLRKKMSKKNSKQDHLKLVMQELNKYGLSVKFASDMEDKNKMAFGIEPLDKFIGGGVLCGNFHVVYGGVGAGKTASALNMIAEAQRNGKSCAFIDLEHTLSKERMLSFGVNLNELILYEDAETAEEAMEVVRAMCKENIVDLIVVDSIQAMTPHLSQYKTKAKTQFREFKEDEMAALAKKMGKFIGGTKDFIFKSKVAVVLIGQARSNIGGYGNLEELTGGKAIKYYSMLTLYMRRGPASEAPTRKMKEYYFDDKGKERYKTVDVPIGFNTVIKIDKHKITGCKAEGSEIRIPFYFESGFKEPLEVEDDNESGT